MFWYGLKHIQNLFGCLREVSVYRLIAVWIKYNHRQIRRNTHKIQTKPVSLIRATPFCMGF